MNYFKKTSLIFTLLLIITSFSHPLFGQTKFKIVDEKNLEIQSRVEHVDKAGWLFFKADAGVKPGELFTTLRTSAGLGKDDEMVLTKEWKDEYGYSHNRYQQYYKGIKVEGGEYSEHFKGNSVEIAHGKIIEDLEIERIPKISEREALNLALKAIGAKEYAWENQEWEIGLKKDLKDSKATYFPDGNMVIGQVFGNEFKKENFRLSWVFQIRALTPASLDVVYVDAQNGKILKLKPVGDHGGTASTLFDGPQDIDTQWRGGTHYNHRLKTNNDGRNIHTKYGTYTDSFWWRSNITDGDNSCQNHIWTVFL